ncbi:hypothetical protein HPB47_000339, partial [Ixodes persulcatus]
MSQTKRSEGGGDIFDSCASTPGHPVASVETSRMPESQEDLAFTVAPVLVECHGGRSWTIRGGNSAGGIGHDDENTAEDSYTKQQSCSGCHAPADEIYHRAPLPEAVVRLLEDHNHNLGYADGLRLLKYSPDTRARFHGYFQDGLNPTKSMSIHWEKTAAAHDAQDQQGYLASGHENPTARTVYHWYEVWRKQHYGELVDPIIKLGETAPMYLQNGADVRTARSQDGCCWA